MIDEIKTIIQNYLNNVKLCSLMTGTVVSDGIKINDKLVIPDELIKGSLKKLAKPGEQVRMIRNHGGQEFYIIEIINKEFVTKGATITLLKDGYSYEYMVKDVRI